MISNNTVRYTIAAVNSGKSFQLSPFTWNPNLKMFVSNSSAVKKSYALSCKKFGLPELGTEESRFCSWKCMIYFSIYFKVVVITYWLIHRMIYEPTLEENVLLVFLCSNCLTSLCVQLMYVSSHEEIIGFINTLMIFDRKLAKVFTRKISRTDGLEWISRQVLYVPSVVAILLIPAIHMILGQDWKVLRVLNLLFSNLSGSRFLVSCVFSFLAAFDWYYVLLFWLIAMIYLNCIYNWFGYQKLWLENNKPDVNCNKILAKDKTHVIFRAHQIIHTISTNLAYNILPLTLIISVFLITTTLICFIRVWRTTNVFFLTVVILVGGATVFILKAVTRMSAGISELSAAYPKSFQSTETKMRKMDKLFLKSCPTLKWNVGRSFQICKNTFGIIMFGTVIDWVINLLLAF